MSGPGMTHDERDRLSRLEANFQTMSSQVSRMDGKIDQLLTAADMGKGAWWLILRIGGVLAVLSGLGVGIWSAMKGH